MTSSRLTASQRRRTIDDCLECRVFAAPQCWRLRSRPCSSPEGTPVRDREARLMKLLTTPGAGSVDRIVEVSKEGGRYSFGGVFNSPVVVHAFLQSVFQDHFRFSLGAQDRAIGPNVWNISFVEV